MMRSLIVFLLVLLPLGDVLAQAQRPFRIYAITSRGMTNVERGFKEHFASRKVPVEITFRDIASDVSRIPGLVEEIRRTRPDLIYTFGTPITLNVVGAYDKVDPAKHITDIPVVFTQVAEPVKAKIVPDLKSSRRNVTGVFNVKSIEEQMRAIASYRPFKTLGVLYDSTAQNSVVTVKEIREVGLKMGFQVVERTFNLDDNKKSNSEGIPELVRGLKEQKADWLYLPPDSFLNRHTKLIVIPEAMSLALPTFASTEGLMNDGALAGLVARNLSLGQFTGYKAEQILVNKKAPSSIPVETLTRFSFQVQMDAATKLNLPPPLPMFNYADFVQPPAPPPAS